MLPDTSLANSNWHAVSQQSQRRISGPVRVGFIYPFAQNSDLQVPLGIGYLTSYLRQELGDDVEVAALDTGIATPAEIEQFLGRPFDILGFSVSSRTYRESIMLLHRYKHLHPFARIIYGGPHVSMMKEETLLREPAIDMGVYGEGEVTFLELVKALHGAQGDVSDEVLASIDGLIWRRGEEREVVVNEEREQVANLDDLPFPAFDLFPVTRYPSQYPMATSRGCPFRCTFCTVVTLWGNRAFRVHSAKYIVDEIEHRVAHYGNRPVVIHDDAFNTRLDRLVEICEEIIKRNLRIPFGVRGFRIDILDEERADLLKRAGCVSIAIGVESANNDMLADMLKGTTIEVMDKGITMLRKRGIAVRGQFMIGNPGETLDTVRESIEFALKSDLTSSAFSMAVPFPKTPLWDYAADHGRYLVEKDVTTFDEVVGKLIFETEDFPVEDRIQAREMAREAGLFYQRAEGLSLRHRLRESLKGLWYKGLYPKLPRSLTFRLNSWLMHRSVGAFVTHDQSAWARSRRVDASSIRMKGLDRGRKVPSAMIG